MKIIVIGSRAYNELVGRIEKIEAAIASLPEKGRAWKNGQRFGCSSFSVQYRVHTGELPDDSSRRGPSDKPPSEGFGIPGF